MSYKDLNGLERDIGKLRYLYRPWLLKMRPHIDRFKARPTPHNFTNLCTESSRADPYVNGHIMAVSTGLVIVIIAGLGYLAI